MLFYVDSSYHLHALRHSTPKYSSYSAHTERLGTSLINLGTCGSTSNYRHRQQQRLKTPVGQNIITTRQGGPFTGVQHVSCTAKAQDASVVSGHPSSCQRKRQWKEDLLIKLLT